MRVDVTRACGSCLVMLMLPCVALASVSLCILGEHARGFPVRWIERDLQAKVHGTQHAETRKGNHGSRERYRASDSAVEWTLI